MKFFLLIFLLVPGILVGQNPWKNVYTESAWAERDGWQKPDELIRHLNLMPGSLVADIGCHEGYMTFKLSNAVGKYGKVYAVDNRMVVISLLNSKLEEREVTNVKTISGSASEVYLPTDSLDGILILDSYHEMKDYMEVLYHLKQSLKKDGRLVICEPIANERKTSSREDQEKRHELGINYALEDLAKAGFEILFKSENFVDRTTIKGDMMWVIVARRK